MFTKYFKINSIENSLRNLKYKKSLKFSVIIKLLDVLIGLALVPIFLHILGEEKYGLWLTISSFTTMFFFLDGGLSQGLRNMLSESNAKGKILKAQEYVSTTYFFISVIGFLFSAIALVAVNYFDWSSIFNSSYDQLEIILVLLITGVVCQLILNPINEIHKSFQKPYKSDLNKFLIRFLILFGIIISTLIDKDNLFAVSLIHLLAPFLVLMFSSIFHFNTDYKFLKPRVNKIDFSLFSKIFGIGNKFLLINLSLIIIFQTDNLIITNLFGPIEVTSYQIPNRIFLIPYTIFLILLSPLWSSSTEAYIKQDFLWIKRIINKYLFFGFLFSICILILVGISQFLYRLWLGDNIDIPFRLSLLWGILYIVQIFIAIFFQVINGASKIRIQFYVYLFSLVLNIPLSLFFANYLKLGPSGVILATILCQALHFLYLPNQYYKLVNNKLSGLWDS